MAEYPHFACKSDLLSPAKLEITTKGYLKKYDSTQKNWMLQSKCIQFQDCHYYQKMTTGQLMNNPIIINIGILSKDNESLYEKGNFYIDSFVVVLFITIIIFI